MSKEMSFEEYKQAVKEAGKDFPLTKLYPKEYEQAFNEEIEFCFSRGDSVDAAAQFIDLMI